MLPLRVLLIRRLGMIAAVYLWVVWPLLLYPMWPLGSVWDVVVWAAGRLGFPGDARGGAFLVWFLMSLASLSMVAGLHLLNNNVPVRARLLRGLVLVAGSVPLGYVCDGRPTVLLAQTWSYVARSGSEAMPVLLVVAAAGLARMAVLVTVTFAPLVWLARGGPHASSGSQ